MQSSMKSLQVGHTARSWTQISMIMSSILKMIMSIIKHFENTSTLNSLSSWPDAFQTFLHVTLLRSLCQARFVVHSCVQLWNQLGNQPWCICWMWNLNSFVELDRTCGRLRYRSYRYIYIDKITVFTTSVGLAQARPNKRRSFASLESLLSSQDLLRWLMWAVLHVLCFAWLAGGVCVLGGLSTPVLEASPLIGAGAWGTMPEISTLRISILGWLSVFSPVIVLEQLIMHVGGWHIWFLPRFVWMHLWPLPLGLVSS